MSAHRNRPTLLESSVKAAYLYKFSGYVEWPATSFESATSPLVFGVIGDPRSPTSSSA
jgi:hypothetical protein